MRTIIWFKGHHTEPFSTLWGLIFRCVFIIISEVERECSVWFANIAQSVEQLIRNHQVAGSIPVVGTI